MIIYPDNFEQKVGFHVVRERINAHCISPLGKYYNERMRFSTRYDEVTLALTQTTEFVAILKSKREFPLDHFFDLRAPLKSLATPGAFISLENLFQLRRVMSTTHDIARFFEHKEGVQPHPTLARLAAELQPMPQLLSAIDAIIDKNGNMKDNASPLLMQLRTAMMRLTASINGILRRVIGQGREQGYLDKDVAPSVRDGRLVLPVSPMHKRKVRGIVHDESATGKTVFIEPEEIVEANNHSRETEGEIQREIVRILTQITDEIRPHIHDLLQAQAVLGKIDFIRAKALFAQEIGATMPHVQQEPHIEWFHAVHPALFLSLQAQGKEVVPMDIELNRQQRILLISGPNAGGKSVCLKTVGVVQYMMQCGVLPPVYDNSHMGFFENIFIDIGDQQSIEDDLSTYSSHLLNMKTLLQRGDGRSLVLIDEFGGGTEPQIGGAIAQAILGQLNERRVFGVITTHYQNLKHFAQETTGIVNGAMLYDRQAMRPLFQLSIGYPGSSFAIEIARKTGLPRQVIDEASRIVGSDYVNMDKYLLDIVRDRKYWEHKRQEVHNREKRLNQIIDDYNERLERISAEHKAIIKDAKNEAKDILKQSNARIEQTIREIKETQAQKEKTRQVRQQLAEFKARLEAEDDTALPALAPLPHQKGAPRPKKKPAAQRVAAAQEGPLAVGDNVVMKGSTTVGTVIATDEKFSLVAFGNIKTRVETSRLERTLRKAPASNTPSVSRATTEQIRDRQLHFSPEIDVRGMRGDEAVQAVTYFIDDAIQFGTSRVRILHGTGTGALREVIRQYLNTVNGVRSYHDEDVRFGGAGITIVNLD